MLFRPAPLVSALLIALAAFLPPILRLYRLENANQQRDDAHLEFIRNFIDVIPQPVYVKDANSRYLIVNRAFTEEFARPVEDILGRTTGEIQDNAQDSQLSRKEDLDVLAGLQLTVERQDIDPIRHMERHRVIMKGACPGLDGEPVIVGSNFDVTHWRIAERLLQTALNNETALRQRTEAFIQRLIDVIPDPVYIKKRGGIYVMVNDAFSRYRNVDKLAFKGFAPTKTPEQHQLSMDEDERVIAGEEITKEDHTIRQSTGEEVFRIISKRPSVFVDGDPVIVGVEHHITEWRVAERELKRLAEEDMLTGIANRRYFHIEAERAMEHARRHNERLSLVLIDVDHFKHINDHHGHNVGDEVLRALAQRMRDCFRKSDLPGRWGGEEFIALLPHTVLDTALVVAERLRAQFNTDPITTSAGPLSVTFSGGSAEMREDDTLESLVARADSALYRAKHGGRNRIEADDEGSKG